MRSAGKNFHIVSLDADPQATRLLPQINSTFLAQSEERALNTILHVFS